MERPTCEGSTRGRVRRRKIAPPAECRINHAPTPETFAARASAIPTPRPAPNRVMLPRGVPSRRDFAIAMQSMSRRTKPTIEPCLPRAATEPPTGPDWIHEIKHDGFRILARRDEGGVRLFTRNGYDFADRFPLIAKAVAALPVRSCFIDGEAIVVDRNGLSVFDLLRYRQHDGAAVLCAFDLLELEGQDFRPAPLEERKDVLGKLLLSVRRSHTGITLNEHYEGDGVTIYKHACRFGCKGIVSKRLGYPYRSGRVNHWLKMKNPTAPAVKREAEEDWGAKRRARRT
jgi:bifunctional non-homologous end joining protein LigD